MHTPKIFLLYEALSESERAYLGKFLASPFFNQRKDVIRLYTFLNQVVDWEGLSREEVFAEVYPNESFDVVKYRLLLSFLHKRIDAFFIQLSLKEDTGKQSFYLLEAYEKRNLNKHTKIKLKALKKELNSHPGQDPDHRYRVEYFQHEYNTQNPREQRAITQSLQDLSQELDTYYVINKLKQACAILNHRKVLHSWEQLTGLDIILPLIREMDLLQEPMVNAYFLIHQILSTTGEQRELYFNELASVLQSLSTILPALELNSIYLLALNHCIQQINTGNTDYHLKTYHLYQIGLETRALFEHQQLSPSTFNNIAALGLKLNRVDEVDAFIKRYKGDLPAAQQDRIFFYNLAELQLKKGNHQEAARILQTIQTKDPFTTLISRISLIKAYFELSEQVMLGYALENLKQLVRRKTTLTYHKILAKNFIKFTKFILNLRPYDKRGREDLLSKLKATQIVAQKDWLIEKIRG